MPDEDEWEYAARGDGRRLWTWGVEPPIGEEAARRCNIYEGENPVSGTTPVGIYPLGATPLEKREDRIFDLVGNVWEWCQDWWDKREIYRVLRGGSWSDSSAAITPAAPAAAGSRPPTSTALSASVAPGLLSLWTLGLLPFALRRRRSAGNFWG